MSTLYSQPHLYIIANEDILKYIHNIKTGGFLMNKRRFLNIFLLCLGGAFCILGAKYGAFAYAISSVAFIVWAILFIGKGKKHTM